MFRRLALFALLTLLPIAALAQRAMDAAELQLALRKLNVVGSALFVAAHPDDENTAVLAWLSNERLMRTGYLSMTRGDGGQNLLGDEKGELLGVVRTQELLAARRIDGAEQYFTRAIDFGYSRSPAEALDIWGHDTILADTVWIVRKLQPDVVINRFPVATSGTHGHHLASAMLSVEAFQAAGDPARFPEQLKWVKPWQPKRLLWNRATFMQAPPGAPPESEALRIDVGSYNALLGRSYSEIAGESRSQHKSQGMGAPERRGTNPQLLNVIAGAPATSDLFEGVNTTWTRYPGGERVGNLLQQAADTFDPRNPAKSLPLLMQAYDALQQLASQPEWTPPKNPWVDVKTRDLLDVILACAGVSIDISATDSAIVPGGSMAVTVNVVNRSDYPFTLQTVASPFASPGIVANKALQNNVPVKNEIRVTVPPDSAYSQPYWLQKPPSRGAFSVDDQRLIGLPENPPAIPIVVTLTDPQLRSLSISAPAVYRWIDPIRGEVTRRVDIVPEITANPGSRVYVFPDAKPRSVAVTLHDFAGPVSGRVRIVAPAGWTAEPPSRDVKFENKGQEARVTFDVTPPKNDSTAALWAEVELADGKKVMSRLTEIDYPHIPPQRVFGDSSAKLVRADIRKRGTRIGYIMGAGDDVAEGLRQVGYDVTLLTDSDLDRGEFAKYDAIVAGVRAYNGRKAMAQAHAKLMKYVENGGTVVVQYNSLFPQRLLVDPPGPYPFKVSDERVTVETAPVKLLAPSHPLLNVPNKITSADFEGWVQERGLYFTTNWDPRYTTILATADPGESDKPGGELFVRYGKGVFVYTSYAWFRQLPAGVPGAYRLFANLVSAR